MHLIGQYIWTTKKLSNIYANNNYRNIVGGIIDYDFDVNEDAIEIEMTRPAVPGTTITRKVEKVEDAIEIEMTKPAVPSKGKKMSLGHMWSSGNWAAQ